ncbi:hypothetical protein N7537_006031 [Penicillium hordei]|uniref:Uncharacterized protein n=1 Tax=Penicillium hordei TaxID=40994 RepID=A0AAD6E6Q8_9EURO|nr:uncharacterized protein N7537_006031 [Penicillium hordei]KAJ5603075.1 hypothetical protein N7537_006031 [Penicillium hordei]
MTGKVTIEESTDKEDANEYEAEAEADADAQVPNHADKDVNESPRDLGDLEGRCSPNILNHN